MSKSFKDKVFIARQLSLSEWLLMAEAWWVLLGFSLALRWINLERLEKTLRLAGRNKVDPSAVLVFAHRLQKLVFLASRLHLISMTCLIRACALHWMLGRRAIPSRLCIGLNRSQVGIQAHAWVEVMGQAIGEVEDIDNKFKVLEPISTMKAASLKILPCSRDPRSLLFLNILLFDLHPSPLRLHCRVSGALESVRGI